MGEKKLLDKHLAAGIDNLLKKYQYDGSQLVNLLLDVQEIVPQKYVPEEAACYLAQELDVKVTTVYDCITFYAALYDKPRAAHPLQVCESVVCHVNNSGGLLKNLQELLKVGLNEATADGKFIIESVPCFGACDVAPAVRVDGKVYGHLTSKEKIAAMLADFA